MMIGDGKNDAPALAAADVGISMGVSGSAVATETSHVTLTSDDLQKIPQAVRLARRTHQTILVNIILSIVTKSAVFCLAFVGYPLLWAAVPADVGTCLLVILHGMMLLREEDVDVKKIGCCGSKKIKNCGCCLAGSNGSEQSCLKPNCCDVEAQAKHCHSPLEFNSPNCCGAKEEERNIGERVCLTSCHSKAAAKTLSCQSRCCIMPTKEKVLEKEWSSSQKGCCSDGVDSRETGGCFGKSYKEEVARREDCCEGCENLVKVPEIITE